MGPRQSRALFLHMKCAAIRKDFLSAITEPAKCMEIKHKTKTKSNDKRKENSNPKMLVVTGFLFAAIAHCCGSGNGVDYSFGQALSFHLAYWGLVRVWETN